MSHRCWNGGQRLEKVDVLHSGVMTAPRVYFHRVGQRRQRGYGLWDHPRRGRRSLVPGVPCRPMARQGSPVIFQPQHFPKRAVPLGNLGVRCAVPRPSETVLSLSALPPRTAQVGPWERHRRKAPDVAA